MATKEELFNAVLTIKEYCNSLERCSGCYIRSWCWANMSDQPFGWPDPAEGGGEDGNE